MAMVPDVAAQVQAMAAAAEKPDAVAALGSALTGLGQAYVTFGQAILAIDMKKVASGDAGKKKKVWLDPNPRPLTFPCTQHPRSSAARHSPRKWCRGRAFCISPSAPACGARRRAGPVQNP